MSAPTNQQMSERPGGGWLRLAAAALASIWLLEPAPAQHVVVLPVLARDYFHSGEETLRALGPISAATRHSIVKVDVDEETVALGTVVDADGLVLTKASELKPGKLTCWLATDKEVDAELLGTDEETDVALVRVHDKSLKAIVWSTAPALVGQWAITPGIAETPHALGIISALSRRILPQRAFIGVRFNESNSTPTIASVLPGLGAEKAGLKPGDLVLAVNSAPVTNQAQVIELLREMRGGQRVTLSIEREQQRFDSEMELMTPKSEDGEAPLDQDFRMARMSGQVSRRSVGFESVIEHDTVLLPWLCGGPLVNLDGKAVGLNIARASRVTTYALPASLVRKIIERLKAKGKIS